MAVEAAQIMSTAKHLKGEWLPGMCKPTHIHHPLVKWAKDDRNYLWLYKHYLALCAEWNARSGKVLKILERQGVLKPVDMDLPDPEHFMNCAENKGLGISFKAYQDTHKAYREYLACRWASDKRAPNWTPKES